MWYKFLYATKSEWRKGKQFSASSLKKSVSHQIVFIVKSVQKRSKLLNFAINHKNKCSVRSSVNPTEYVPQVFFKVPYVPKPSFLMVLVPSPTPLTCLYHRKKLTENFLRVKKLAILEKVNKLRSFTVFAVRGCNV